MFFLHWAGRNKLLIAIVALLLLPVVLTGFMLFQTNKVEQYLIKHQRTKLAGVVDGLDQTLAVALSALPAASPDQEVSRERQVAGLTAALKDFVAAKAPDFPELEVGFYSRELNTLLVKGTGDYYLGRTFPAIQEQLLQQAREGRLDVNGQRSGTVIEIYKPFIVNGRVAGVVWGTENLNLSGIQDRVETAKHDAYVIIFLALCLGLGGSVLLIKNFIAGVHRITNGLRHLEYDLNHTLPPVSGEFGEITAAINHLSAQLTRAQNFNQITLASINDGVLAIDLKGRVITLNAAARRIFALPPETLGRPAADVFPPDTPFAGMLGEALTGTTPAREQRVAWPTPDRGTLQLLVSTAPLVNGRQQVIGAVLNCLDITEGVRLQERLHLQERLAALGKLVAGVAHEIRNPLTSISGYIEYLEKNKNPAPRSWANINREINRLNLIVEKLLFFARPAQTRFVPADLNSLVENTLQFFVDTGRDKVTIVKELAANLPPANIDPEQIEQVLKNILFNAYQAMPDGGTLTVATGPAAGDFSLYVAISDTGAGIPAEDLPRLFDPFFTTRARGTGLGLTIAYEIIKAHGGTIEVDSTPGAGATFCLYLPAVRGEI